MQERLKILICSDLDYEKLVADVAYDNQTVATISQENGIDKMEIVIFPPDTIDAWSFPLDEFVEIISFAKKRLVEMQKLSE